MSPEIAANGEAAWRRRGVHYRFIEPQKFNFPNAVSQSYTPACAKPHVICRASVVFSITGYFKVLMYCRQISCQIFFSATGGDVNRRKIYPLCVRRRAANSTRLCRLFNQRRAATACGARGGAGAARRRRLQPTPAAAVSGGCGGRSDEQAARCRRLPPPRRPPALPPQPLQRRPARRGCYGCVQAGLGGQRQAPAYLIRGLRPHRFGLPPL